jgi:hypothetical protein
LVLVEVIINLKERKRGRREEKGRGKERKRGKRTMLTTLHVLVACIHLKKKQKQTICAAL